MSRNFPKDFFWGTATSSHQVEGNNFNNWSEWEKKNAERLAKESFKKFERWQQEKFPEMFDSENYLSGVACDHYNRYKEDFDLVKMGGHNAHRFSIEWSRIEPEKGKFDRKEIEHYRKVLVSLKERGLEPFVTLWHWTHPVWLEEMDGVANKKFSYYFSRYAKVLGEEFNDLVKFWLTINEPMSIIPLCYLKGEWPPQKRNLITALKVYRNLSSAHRDAYDILHEVNSDFKVGFANILGYFEPANKNSFLDRLVVKVGEYFGNKRFLKLTQGKNDFLTLQYYIHYKLSFFSGRKNEDIEVNDLGWGIYQEGIYHLLKFLDKYNLPIYITENGLADIDDSKRGEFIKEGLFWVKKAINEGVDVRGFFYWSLMDNFEWDKGFWPRFGLVEIDRKTLKRKPRKSFYVYKNIIEENSIN